MTEQEQQIALCEWMGCLCQHCKKEIGIGEGHPIGWCNCEKPQTLDTNSLDVLHEMELRLTNQQYDVFWNIHAVKCHADHPARQLSDRAFLSASPSRRREALLKTLGLWKD